MKEPDLEKRKLWVDTLLGKVKYPRVDSYFRNKRNDNQSEDMTFLEKVLAESKENRRKAVIEAVYSMNGTPFTARFLAYKVRKLGEPCTTQQVAQMIRRESNVLGIEQYDTRRKRFLWCQKGNGSVGRDGMPNGELPQASR